MKHFVTLIFLYLSLGAFCQIDPHLGMYPQDTCNFESVNSHFSIDTTNNDWQVGSTNKSFFGQANSLPNAIMTDTINSYSTNKLSYFDLSFGAWDMSGFPFNLYVKFDHKYETDSLLDGGYLTVSFDTGQTWRNVLYDSTCIGCFNNPYNINIENFYSHNDTLINGEPGFTGVSNWKTSGVQWIWMYPVKQQPSDSMILRFNFISDSTQTHKDGWIIDNIEFGWVDLGSSVEELKEDIDVSLYPNITNDYFNYKLLNGKLKSISIFNIKGQILYNLNNPNKRGQINVSNLSKGSYFVKFNSNIKSIFKRLIIY